MAFNWRTLAGTALVASALTLSACGSDGPSAPTDLPPATPAVTAASATSASVTWTAVTGATNYIVQRATGTTGGTFVTISPASLTTTSFLDTGLEPNAAIATVSRRSVCRGPSQYTAEISVTTNPAGTVAGTINTNVTANRTLFADTVYT